MKWLSLAALTALASAVTAEDLLFINTLVGSENTRAKSLGYTTKVITEAQWRTLKTSDFAAYKAIILGDDFGASNLAQIKFLADTKDVWGPAVQGNIIVHGADQSNHGKTVLIDNSIKFAASGTGTGLYFSLSQYYDSLAVSNVDALDYFGTFEVRGQLDCYDKVHIVASSPSIDTLTDEYLSDWGCSVHEAFSVFPSVGLNGFQAIAIADGVVAPGTQQFAGGHTGLPYIITRGATPAGCGDGRWDEPLGEECDDGSQNGKPGSACSISCKCLSGKAKGDGSCLVGNNSSTPIGTGTGIGTGITPSGSTLMPPGTASSGNPTGYSNSTSSGSPGGFTPPYPTATPPYPTTSTPPYVTPSPPSTSCIGVEVIVSMTVVESCSTIAPSSTVTYTTTSACSTYQRPIYNTPIPTAPCYVCAFSSQRIPTKSIGFFTATTTHCPACSAEPMPPTIYACATCSAITLTETCPLVSTPPFSAVPYTTYAPHTHIESNVTQTNPGIPYSAVTITVMPTGTHTPVQLPSGAATASIVQYTGAAAVNRGGLGIAGAVAVAAALAL